MSTLAGRRAFSGGQPPRLGAVAGVACAVVLAAAAARGGAPSPPREPATTALRALFIGNSLTMRNNLPRLVQGLAQSHAWPRSLKYERMLWNAATLEWLAAKREVLDKVRQGKWHYVVLQEQGLRPIREPAKTRAAARKLQAAAAAGGARTVLFLTWACRDRPEDLGGVSRAIKDIARGLGARVAPVGEAWAAAREARPDLELYHRDGIHPSPVGSYLAACVIYGTLFGESPQGLAGGIRAFSSPRRPGPFLVNLDDADAAFLQRVAWDAVKRLRPAPSSVGTTRPAKAAAPRKGP